MKTYLFPLKPELLKGVKHGHFVFQTCVNGDIFTPDEDDVYLLMNGRISHITGTASVFQILLKDTLTSAYILTIPSASDQANYDVFKELGGGWIPIVLTHDMTMKITVDSMMGGYIHCLWLKWNLRTEYKPVKKKRGFWEFLP